jgi:hypothetical protein
MLARGQCIGGLAVGYIFLRTSVAAVRVIHPSYTDVTFVQGLLHAIVHLDCSHIESVENRLFQSR